MADAATGLQGTLVGMEKAKLRKVLRRFDLALLRLRRLYPDAPRPYRVPGGIAGAWVAVVITELFVLVTALAVMVVLGLLFWAAGERARRRGLVGIAIPAEGGSR